MTLSLDVHGIVLLVRQYPEEACSTTVTSRIFGDKSEGHAAFLLHIQKPNDLILVDRTTVLPALCQTCLSCVDGVCCVLGFTRLFLSIFKERLGNFVAGGYLYPRQEPDAKYFPTTTRPSRDIHVLALSFVDALLYPRAFADIQQNLDRENRERLSFPFNMAAF